MQLLLLLKYIIIIKGNKRYRKKWVNFTIIPSETFLNFFSGIGVAKDFPLFRVWLPFSFYIWSESFSFLVEFLWEVHISSWLALLVTGLENSKSDASFSKKLKIFKSLDESLSLLENYMNFWEFLGFFCVISVGDIGDWEDF